MYMRGREELLVLAIDIGLMRAANQAVKGGVPVNHLYTQCSLPMPGISGFGSTITEELFMRIRAPSFSVSRVLAN